MRRSSSLVGSITLLGLAVALNPQGWAKDEFYRPSDKFPKEVGGIKLIGHFVATNPVGDALVLRADRSRGEKFNQRYFEPTNFGVRNGQQFTFTKERPLIVQGRNASLNFGMGAYEVALASAPPASTPQPDQLNQPPNYAPSTKTVSKDGPPPRIRSNLQEFFQRYGTPLHKLKQGADIYYDDSGWHCLKGLEAFPNAPTDKLKKVVFYSAPFRINVYALNDIVFSVSYVHTDPTNPYKAGGGFSDEQFNSLIARLYPDSQWAPMEETQTTIDRVNGEGIVSEARNFFEWAMVDFWDKTLIDSWKAKLEGVSQQKFERNLEGL